MDTLGIITETKVTRRLDLGDYEETWRGAVFDVWVAPPRGHLQRFFDINDWMQEHDADSGLSEELRAELYGMLDPWLAETWTNIELEAVTQIREHLQDVDIDAWSWLYTNTLEAITDYRARRVKNSSAPSTAS